VNAFRTKLLRVAFSLMLVASCRPGPAGSTPARARNLACEGSKPVIISGNDTGFQTCSNGMRHRPKAVKCPSFLPRSDDGVSNLRRHISHYDELSGDEAGSMPCIRDSDCSARAYGHCEPTRPSVMTWCAYGCVSDSECSSGELCLCGDPVGGCVPATCRIDSDCGPPYVCGDYEPIDVECGDTDAFACQTKRDECAVLCPHPRLFCTFSQGRRVCSDECGIT
jgi:hypothetical protein